MDEHLNRTVEDACLNAWPALKEIFYDGWLVRLSEGHTRRCNSVNVIGPGQGALDEKIDTCERLYRAHGLPPLFRIRSVDDPALGRALDARGYRAEDETRTLCKRFAGDLPAPPGDVELVEGGASAEWLKAQARFAGRPLRRNDIRKRLLELVALPVAFAARRDAEGRIVSVAYGAVHDRLVSLQWVVTDKTHRGKGHARATLSALMHWAAARGGAEGACLQVIATNAPAVALYEKLGFDRELYRYHYRVLG
jgi:ribosomal protein S18 acetylase RimI-like enzyme